MDNFESQFSLKTWPQVSQHAPEEAHTSKNIWIAQAGSGGYENEKGGERERVGWVGKGGIDLGGVGGGIIRIQYTKYSNN